MTTYQTILGMARVLRRLRRREAWTRPQIEAHQSATLAQLRAHAYAYSPFYQKHHAGLFDRPLEELPILTKTMLHEHFDEIVTEPAIKRAAVAAHVPTLRGAEQFLDQYIVNTTSGTTGRPNYILFNRQEWSTVLASFSRFERHIGSFWGTVLRPKIAIVASSTPWHISARIGITVRSSVLPILRLDVGEPLASVVQQLNAWQPQVLATYASMAGILADEQVAGRLQIAPRRIVCTAEVLSSALRQRIQAAWGGIVFDQYGATEGGTFAVECESPYRSSGSTGDHIRGLHLFEDLFVLEVVDHQNRPVPPGQYGDKVLLTVLFNHTQPLIRYELSDSVRMSDRQCSCGCAFALIDDVQGRTEEVLHFPSRAGGQVAVHPVVFYRILDAIPVHGWQVVQHDDRLYLRLSGNPRGINEQSLINEVQEALGRQNAVSPAIAVEWLAGMERGTTGKAPRIVIRP